MTNDRDLISSNIATCMERGLDVFDAEGSRVGDIADYDTTLGYMSVRPNPFSERLLYVPFRSITHIDPRGVFLSESVATVNRQYDGPPPVNVLLDQRLDPETGEDDSRAVFIEASGYDGAPTVAEVSRIGRLAHQIAHGFHVYTSQLEHIGRIDRYDRRTGQMLVKRDFAPWEPVVVPLALVDEVDNEKNNVYLAVSAADLKRHPRVERWNADEGASSQVDDRT